MAKCLGIYLLFSLLFIGCKNDDDDPQGNDAITPLMEVGEVTWVIHVASLEVTHKD